MRRTDIPPTKSNLLRLREHFGFVKSGHELLDQKREVLLEALMDIYREAGELRRTLEADLAKLYAGLQAALLAAGRPILETEATADAGVHQLRGRERSVMGAIIPLLELESVDRAGPTAAPGWTPPAADHTRGRVRRLLPSLVRLAEIEVSCRRLATELQKTQRKVNALENIFIPEYRDTIHFIEGSLEEKEREALFQMKRLKGRRAASPEGALE
jgi:V/A-type H+/Na+-transporting ATPase subunit D